MQTEQLATRVTQVIKRGDGSEAKIVAQDFSLLDKSQDIEVYVLRRESPMQEWKLCSKTPHPDWRTMSVDDYKKYGRSEMLQTASQGEILRVVSMVGKPMSAFA